MFAGYSARARISSFQASGPSGLSHPALLHDIILVAATWQKMPVIQFVTDLRVDRRRQLSSQFFVIAGRSAYIEGEDILHPISVNVCDNGPQACRRKAVERAKLCFARRAFKKIAVVALKKSPR